MLRRLLIAVAASVCMSFTASADGPKGFQTGVYIGVNGGYQIGATELDLNATGFGSIANIDGLSTRGITYGVHGGFDFRVSGTPFLIGLVGSYQRGEAEHDISIMGGNILSAAIEPTWKAGARAGYVLPNGSLVYAGYQFAKADMTVSSPLFGTISRSLDGDNILAGVEIPVTDFATVGLQYDWTRYDSTNLLPASAAPFNLDAATEVHAVTARVNIRLQNIFGQ